VPRTGPTTAAGAPSDEKKKELDDVRPCCPAVAMTGDDVVPVCTTASARFMLVSTGGAALRHLKATRAGVAVSDGGDMPQRPNVGDWRDAEESGEMKGGRATARAVGVTVA